MKQLQKGCAAESAGVKKQNGMAGSVLSALSMLLAPKQAILDPASPDSQIGEVTFTHAGGRPLTLSGLAGETILVVNTASKCGFRSQFADLQSLHDDLAHHGLVVLGVPSNDFGSQEPGDDRTIHEIYRSQLHLTFPITEKVSARGKAIHPFFSHVSSVAGEHAAPKWNFYKYVIAPNGNLAAWFSTPIRASSPRVRHVIENCLQMEAVGGLAYS